MSPQCLHFIGRTKDGLMSEIHAVVDATGNPLRIFFTVGNVNDAMPAEELLADLSGQASCRSSL